MKSLLTLRDGDIFSNIDWEIPLQFGVRVAVKCILFDKNRKLALVGTQHQLLPGGGVENGEALEEAVIREIQEEVGCRASNVHEFVLTEEYRGKIARHQETHFFTAEIQGEKGTPCTTQEDEQGIEVKWFTLDEAINLLEHQAETISYKSYNSCFNVRTHLATLLEFKKQQRE